MRLLTTTLIVLVLGAGHAQALAASTCNMDQTIPKCRDAVNAQFPQQEPPTDSKATERAQGAQANTLEGKSDNQVGSKNTGTMSPSGDGAVVSDLASLINFAFGNESLDADKQAITVDLNRILPIPQTTKGDFQLKATLREAELFKPLRDAVTGDNAKESIEMLEEKLDDFDDVALTFSYSLNSKNLGRSTEGKAFLDDLFLDVVTKAKTTVCAFDIGDTAKLLVDALKDAGETPQKFFQSNLSDELLDATTFKMLADALPSSNKQLAKNYLDAIECGQRSQWQAIATIDEALAELEFDRFADLLANQPQLVFSLEGRFRNELVGPDEVKAKLSFEKGWNNANTLRSKCSGDPHMTSCYKTFMDTNRKAIQRSHRMKLGIEYTDIESYDQTFLDDAVRITQGSDEMLKGSLGYGRVLRLNPAGQATARLDLTWSYEDVDNDSLRQTRSVVNASFSQELTGGFVVTLGAVYANKPEFRGEVDEEVTARFGLTYKLKKKDKK